MMRRLGFTLLEFLICCSLLVTIGWFALPFTHSWLQKNQMDLLSAQIMQVITYSKTQSLLLAQPLRLMPLSGDENWDKGMRLSLDKTKYPVLYEWSWDFTGMHLSWHGFQSNYFLKFNLNPNNQSLNGYFLIESSGHALEKIILNRVGNVRIEILGAKQWSS